MPDTPHDHLDPGETSDPTVSRAEPASSSERASRSRLRTPDPARSSRRPEHRFTPGDLLAERYRIVTFLGKGGMGEVYRADDLELEQPVALKLLPARAAADPLIAERVRGEVRLARQISHRNVCRIHDIARLPDDQGGDLFITMEYVDGEDLDSLLKRIGKLPQDKAIDVARQLCAALAAAHEQGVLHRDLKPANVMLDGKGRVKLTDFGIAAIADEIDTEEASSGTPAYMAPEQYEGKEVNRRSDIYSLGLVLYEILTGHAAWGASTLADLRTLRATHEHPPSLSGTNIAGLDPALATLIDRCIDKDPAERPTSAFAVAAALPGADPLSAALAAGETPSPELIAASGGRGVLAPRVALTIVAANVALIALSIYLSLGTTLLTLAPPRSPPAVMREAALEAITALGHEIPDDPDTRTGWTVSQYAMNEISTAISGGHLDDWSTLDDAFSTPIRYWLRLEPDGFTTTHPSGNVSQNDPPRSAPGSTFVQLDQQRRLKGFYRRPPKKSERSAAATQPDSPDAGNEHANDAPPEWTRAFELAGLDFEQFTPITARRRLGEDADRRMAWTGRYPPDDSGLEPAAIDVFAGAADGKICEFAVFAADAPAAPDQAAATPTPQPETGPEDDQTADQPGRSAPAGAAQSIADSSHVAEFLQRAARWLILGTITLAAGFLAYRNIRLRRSDTRRAIRLGVTVFLLFALAAIISADVLPNPINLLIAPYPIYSLGLGFAFLAIICYVAVEPLARSRWPGSLVSWTRLFSGRFRDPMIGRDILIGVTGGTAIILLVAAAQFAAPYVGVDDKRPTADGVVAILEGPLGMTAQMLAQIAASLLNSAAIAVVVLLTMLLFGAIRINPRWPALLAVAALLIVQSLAVPNVGPLDQIASVIGNLIFLFILDRVGLLAAAAAIGASSVLSVLVNAAPYDHWWATSAAVPALLTLLVLTYAYRIATAGRPLIAAPA